MYVDAILWVQCWGRLGGQRGRGKGRGGEGLSVTCIQATLNTVFFVRRSIQIMACGVKKEHKRTVWCCCQEDRGFV